MRRTKGTTRSKSNKIITQPLLCSKAYLTFKKLNIVSILGIMPVYLTVCLDTIKETGGIGSVMAGFDQSKEVNPNFIQLY